MVGYQLKGEQKLIKLIKLKIIKKSEMPMWYNKHIGEEVKITEFAYYSNGQNYSLNGDIKNIQDILTCKKIWSSEFTCSQT